MSDKSSAFRSPKIKPRARLSLPAVEQMWISHNSNSAICEDAMNNAYAMLAGIATLSILGVGQSASALTMQQCSEKYKAAQAAGGVGSMTWNDFRGAECGAEATMALTTTKTKTTTAAVAPNIEECSARYQAAKAAGTLGSMTWNDFRKSGCVARTATTKPPTARREAATQAPPASTKVSEQQCSARYQAAKAAGTLGSLTWNEFRKAGCPTTIARRSGSMMPTAGTIFPATISRKYSREAAGRARLLTCRDQYEANKSAGIAEPKWTEEGGGYYSECNKRLSQQ